MIKKYFIGAISTILFSLSAIGQEKDSSTVHPKTDSPQLGLLSKVKMSGFIQTQFQTIETPGAECISGGNFPVNTSNRFMIRRARLKAEYSSGIAQYVFQIGGTEEGISVGEIYVEIMEPWFKSVSFTAGIFNRPFSFEVPYSSSKIEYTERSRIFKKILPDEKDFGAMITISPEGNSFLNMFALDAGVFNGTGPNHRDFDNRKDFTSHLTFTKSFFHDKLSTKFGVSYNQGGYDNQRKTHYEWNSGFQQTANDTLALAKRLFKGIDAQLAAKWILGKTQFRGEYVFGTQAGTEKSSKTPDIAPIDDNGLPAPSFSRQFSGGYFLFLHDIAKTNIQLEAKYDWYDPNSQVEGKEIGVLPKTGKVDITYHTFGYGLNYSLSNNIRLLAYYEIIKNEVTNFYGYEKDLSDNVFTLRLQCKF